MDETKEYYIDMKFKVEEQPISRKSLIDGLKSLKPSKKAPLVESDSSFLLSDLKTAAKKEKGPKKKRKKKTLIDDDLFMSTLKNTPVEMDTETYSEDGEESEDFLDIDSLYRDEDIMQEIIDENVGAHKRRKKSENEYRKEFSDELTLLASMLNETKSLGKEFQRQWKSLANSKVRGSSKYANELGNLVLSSQTQQLQIIKEVVAVKKTISDLTIKDLTRKEKVAGAQAGSNSNELLAAQYIQGIVRQGRSEVLSKLNNPMSSMDSLEDDLLSHLESGRSGYQNDEIDEFNDIINRRASEENGSRSFEGSSYIEHENDGVVYKIKYCVDLETWEVIAVDRDNQQVLNYPVPSNEDLGRTKFSDDKLYMKDQFGRSYPVISYYHSDTNNF